MPASDRLTRGVRVGYGSGSVATGAFGTVPGLMLLPYLTDSLGIAALTAGFIVFLPKAWDVVLNPIAGRISDRTVDPRGPRRPWLLRAGIALAAGFALLFAAPDLGRRCSRPRGCWSPSWPARRRTRSSRSPSSPCPPR